MKCPLSNCSFTYFNYSDLKKHFLEKKDDKEHFDFIKIIGEKYSINLMSPDMIKNELGVSKKFIELALEFMNIKIRNHVEAVSVSVQQNRQNISAYGNGYFREDLQCFFRSNPEANFARILKMQNINFEYEKRFSILDKNGKLLCTYGLDFFIEKFNQGIEIKGYQEKNGDFKNRPKILLFKKQYPNIKFKVLFCDSKEWKDLVAKYKPLIYNWES